MGCGQEGGACLILSECPKENVINRSDIHVGPITNLSGDRALTLTQQEFMIGSRNFCILKVRGAIFQGRDIFCPEGPGLSVDLEALF